MRKFICFLGIATCSFATATEIDPPRIKTDQPSQIKTSFIPYVQLAYGVLPGAGCSVRIQKAYLGLQFDANAAIFIAPGVGEVTLSPLFYLQAKSDRNWNYGGWNLGIGGGLGYWHGFNDREFSPVFPFFVGYQGQKYFFSATVHPLDRGKSWQKWVPSVKYGWCF